MPPLMLCPPYYAISASTFTTGLAVFFGNTANGDAAYKYQYATDVVASTTAISPPSELYGTSSNATTAVLVSRTTSKEYVFASQSVGTTSSIGLDMLATCGFGNATQGMISGRWANLGDTFSYAYAAKTWIRQTGMTPSRSHGIGHSSVTYGYVSGGLRTSPTASVLTTSKYNYASASWGTGATLANDFSDSAGCSNSSFGVFCNTNDNILYRYNYGSDSVIPGTSLVIRKSGYGAASCSSFGVFAGGNNSSQGELVASTDKVVFATFARTATTNLLSPMNYVVSASDSHGGL